MIVIEVMITVVDTTEGMTMIEGMAVDMSAVTTTHGMTAITVAIVTIETTDPFWLALRVG
ncbi:hypothetical protein ACYZTX_12310 [Pseudomonas sp. MDT1-17]